MSENLFAPAELSGFSAKNVFISHTEITSVFIQHVGVSPLSLCRHVCALMCVKRGQRSAAAGSRAL